MTDIQAIKDLMNTLKEKRRHYGRLNWAKYTTGFDFGLGDAYREIMDFYRDKDNYKLILDYREKDLAPLDKRRIDIIHNDFKNHHLSDDVNRLVIKITDKSNHLSRILNTHRSRIKGRDVSSVEIQGILSGETDENLRKEAFLARAQVNEPLIEGGFIDLIRMRKELACLLEADSFVEVKLEQDELKPGLFDGWIENVREVLPDMKKRRAEYAAKYLAKDTIAPWDEEYLSGLIAPQLNHRIDMTGFYEPVKNFFKFFGIDIEPYNITYDVFSRKNKSEWGYNFPIQTRKDSRILANIRDRFYEFRVLLHETGHAVHSFINDPADELLNAGISGIITEGFANLFGNMFTHKTFYDQFFGGSPEAAADFKSLEKWKKINILRAVPAILFDQGLYLNRIETPSDIHNLKWEMDRKILDEAPYAEVPVWGFRIHHTTHPVYLHNYFLGDLTCEMIKSVFLEKEGIGDVTERPVEFGQFVIENVIKPSGTYPFQELFEKISGEKISFKYLKD